MQLYTFTSSEARVLHFPIRILVVPTWKERPVPMSRGRNARTTDDAAIFPVLLT